MYVYSTLTSRIKYVDNWINGNHNITKRNNDIGSNKNNSSSCQPLHPQYHRTNVRWSMTYTLRASHHNTFSFFCCCWNFHFLISLASSLSSTPVIVCSWSEEGIIFLVKCHEKKGEMWAILLYIHVCILSTSQISLLPSTQTLYLTSSKHITILQPCVMINSTTIFLILNLMIKKRCKLNWKEQVTKSKTGGALLKW
jgi:hypothetical protein